MNISWKYIFLFIDNGSLTEVRPARIERDLQGKPSIFWNCNYLHSIFIYFLWNFARIWFYFFLHRRLNLIYFVNRILYISFVISYFSLKINIIFECNSIDNDFLFRFLLLSPLSGLSLLIVKTDRSISKNLHCACRREVRPCI